MASNIPKRVGHLEKAQRELEREVFRMRTQLHYILMMLLGFCVLIFLLSKGLL